MRTITRRSLLAAGVGTVGAGSLVASDTHRARRWLHSARILDGPDLAPPDVHPLVEYEDFESASMHRSVRWGLARPAPAVRAVVVCLHGRGASHRFAFETIGLHRFIADAGLPWAVASADGGPSSYWHRRKDGTDPQRMVTDELLPMLRERLGPVPIALLGWSMGGYGALLAAADHRTVVSAVVASSPAVWASFSQSAPGAFDGAKDFATHDLSTRLGSLRAMPVRIDCGEDDPFIGAARDLASRLPDAEAQFGDGFHEAASWRHRVPRQLTFLRRALPA